MPKDPPDKRDLYVEKLPPADVAEQLAPRTYPRPDSAFSEHETTPIFGDPITRLEKRTKDASGAARGAFAAIREVRMEMKEGHRDMNTRIDRNTDKMDNLQSEISNVKEDLGDVKVAVATIATKMDAVLEVNNKATDALISAQRALVESATLRIRTDTDLDAHRERTEIELTAKRENAELELTAKRERAEIDETNEQRRDRRKRIWWALGIVGAAITTALAILKAALG